MNAIIQIILIVAFVILSILLTAIVLMQEGKGGGLGSAFGGAGGEAFGHGAGGVNKFTAGLATAWMLVAILIVVLD
jgi:preprotein translocase subunit SecG